MLKAFWHTLFSQGPKLPHDWLAQLAGTPWFSSGKNWMPTAIPWLDGSVKKFSRAVVTLAHLVGPVDVASDIEPDWSSMM